MTFKDAAHRQPGICIGNEVFSLRDIDGFSEIRSTLDLFEDWEILCDKLDKAIETGISHRGVDISEIELCAPIQSRQVFGTGANYRKHVIELGTKQEDPSSKHMTAEEKKAFLTKMMDERAKNGTPYAFVKLPSCIAGPYDDIILPNGATEPDWELELGVVIGKGGKHIPQSDAMAHVGGYIIGNDLTVRDRVYREDVKAIGSDWLSSKCPETFLPLGPWILPKQFVEDYGEFHIQLKLNGDVMQDEFAADMIFSVERQIEYISSRVRLLPGDIILTGSPAGNGTHHQRFLRPGDVLTGKISRLGAHVSTCVAETIERPMQLSTKDTK